MKLQAHLPGGESHAIEVRIAGGRAEVVLDDRPISVGFLKLNESRCLLDIGGEIVDAVVSRAGSGVTVTAAGRTFRFELFDRGFRQTAEEESPEGAQAVKAQMPGRVVRLLKGVGDAVARDGAVLVVEAMKMQNDVRSPRSGVICRLAVREGESVTSGQLLFEVKGSEGNDE